MERIHSKIAQVFILLLCISKMSVAAEPQVPFSSGLYVFQNGMKFKSVEEGVKLIKSLGYQGVGSAYPRDLSNLKTACEKEGLEIFSVYLGGKVNAESFSYDKEVSEAIELLKGTNVLLEINIQRGKDPSDAQAIAMVKEIAEKAKAAGLKVVIYPHAGCHIERIDHALKIARATGCENVGIAFNLCHFLKVQPSDDLTTTLTDAKPLLWSVSISGADADGKDWNTLIRPLDEGTYDPSSLLKLLRAMGFDGAIGLQCFNIRIDPKENLSRSMLGWKKHLSAIQEK
jgi:sugar phosphate isomerase/epimerase